MNPKSLLPLLTWLNGSGHSIRRERSAIEKTVIFDEGCCQRANGNRSLPAPAGDVISAAVPSIPNGKPTTFWPTAVVVIIRSKTISPLIVSATTTVGTIRPKNSSGFSSSACGLGHRLSVLHRSESKFGTGSTEMRAIGSREGARHPWTWKVPVGLPIEHPHSPFNASDGTASLDCWTNIRPVCGGNMGAQLGFRADLWSSPRTQWTNQ